jgi:hypothetical protein
MKLGIVFESIHEAARKMNIPQPNLSKYLQFREQGKGKHCRGFTFSKIV